jgi:hypothetical protein
MTTRFRRIAVCGLIATLTGSVAWAQTVDQFDAWMRTIDDKNQSVQQKIALKDAAGAAMDAVALQDTFKLVEGFWVRRGDAQDAVDLSKEARDRAADVVTALTGKDFDGASTQAIKVAETCTTCHRLHRPLP